MTPMKGKRPAKRTLPNPIPDTSPTTARSDVTTG